jgi:transposase
VSLRMGLKNKVHAVLTRNGIDCSFSNVLGKNSRQSLKTLSVRGCDRLELDGYIRLVELLTELIREITTKIKEVVCATPQAQLLMTVAGISYYSALLILSEIGQIDRFKSAKHLCSYAGANESTPSVVEVLEASETTLLCRCMIISQCELSAAIYIWQVEFRCS